MQEEDVLEKKRVYHDDSCAKHAAIFLVACEPNPATFVKIPSGVMRAKGYSDEESMVKTLQMQVRQEIGKIKGWDPPALLRQRLKLP